MGRPVPELRHITPSNSEFTDQAGGRLVGRGLLIGTDGIVKLKWGTGRVETIPAGTLNTGEIHDVEVRAIYSDVTTATDIYVGFDRR